MKPSAGRGAACSRALGRAGPLPGHASGEADGVGWREWEVVRLGGSGGEPGALRGIGKSEEFRFYFKWKTCPLKMEGFFCREGL